MDILLKAAVQHDSAFRSYFHPNNHVSQVRGMRHNRILVQFFERSRWIVVIHTPIFKGHSTAVNPAASA
jgi:hypothetical protein